MKDLTTGKPWKIIIYFALPILIGNIFNLFYNLADTRIIGSFLGNDALAAVGSVSTLSDLIVGFVVGLCNGFAVIIARFFGMGNKENVRKSFFHSLELGIIIAATIMLFCTFFLNGILRGLNVEEIHLADAKGYISVIIAGLLFSVVYNLFAAGLRAIGDAYTPLIFLIVSAVLNVFFDLLMVGRLGMGVRGAGIATVLSQAISAVGCVIYTYKKYSFLRFNRRDFGFSKTDTGMLLESGLSMALMSCLVAFGTLSLQVAINGLGTNIIVAHSATRKLTNLFMLPFGVLGSAMATFAGQNYGAGRMDRVKTGLFSSLIMSYIWVAVVQLMAYTICPVLIKAVTDTSIDEVIYYGTLYQRVDTLFYVAVPTITILRNSLQGIGDHKIPVISSGLELVGKVLFAFLLTPKFGYMAIVWSEPLVWIIMVIPLIISMVYRMRLANKKMIAA